MRRVGALMMAAVLATGLAACGGGDDNDDVSLEDVGGSDETTTTEDSGSDDTAGDIDDVGDFFANGCGEFITVFSAFGAALSGQPIDDETQAAFDDALDSAPEDLRDDFEVFAEAYAEFGERLRDAGIDAEDSGSLEALEVLGEAGEIFEDEDFQEASENITAFLDDNCSAG